jgi:nucleoside-diphosphate-sugar epimerase
MSSHPVTTLVTGAPGWLGTRLVEALVDPESPHQKYSASHHRKVKVLVLPGMNVSSLPVDKIEVVQGSVLDPASLEKAMEGVHTVFHLVGLIHPKKIQQLFDINTTGTKNMLAAAAKAGVKRFVFISSNSAAGVNVNNETLMKESDPPRPYMAYGRSKLEAEHEVMRYHSQGKMETVILRPCWFYGPGNGQPERQLRFLRMIQKGNPIMFGDGSNLRSMSYLDNTIQGMLLAEKVPEANGQIYWIADAHPYSTLEIYRTIAEIFGTALKPRKIPAVSSFICRQVDRTLQAMGQYITEFHVAGEMTVPIACDVSKARKELDYNPDVDLEEGMRRSIDWARKYQGLEI